MYIKSVFRPVFRHHIATPVSVSSMDSVAKCHSVDPAAPEKAGFTWLISFLLPFLPSSCFLSSLAPYFFLVFLHFSCSFPIVLSFFHVC